MDLPLFNFFFYFKGELCLRYSLLRFESILFSALESTAKEILNSRLLDISIHSDIILGQRLLMFKGIES